MLYLFTGNIKVVMYSCIYLYGNFNAQQEVNTLETDCQSNTRVAMAMLDYSVQLFVGKKEEEEECF